MSAHIPPHNWCPCFTSLSAAHPSITVFDAHPSITLCPTPQAEVARNLMLQLGHAASSNLEYECDEDGEGGWWAAGGGDDVQPSHPSAKPSQTHTSRHAQLTAAQNADCATLTGALALILTPQPAGWGSELPGGASAYGVSAYGAGSAAEAGSEANSEATAPAANADIEAAAEASRSSGFGMAGGPPNAAAAGAVHSSGQGQGSSTVTLGGRIKHFIRTSVPSLTQPSAANGTASAASTAAAASPFMTGGLGSHGPVLGQGRFRRCSLDPQMLQAGIPVSEPSLPPLPAAGVAAVAVASSPGAGSLRSPVGSRRPNSVAPDQHLQHHHHHHQRQSSLSQAPQSRLTAPEGLPLVGYSPVATAGAAAQATRQERTDAWAAGQDGRSSISKALFEGARLGIAEDAADLSSAPAPDDRLAGADVSGPLAPMRVNKVRRPPRRVASALAQLGQPSQQLRRRSLLLNAAAVAEHLGGAVPISGSGPSGGSTGASLQPSSLRAASSQRIQLGSAALTNPNTDVPRIIIDGPAPGAAGAVGGGGGGMAEHSGAPGERLTDMSTLRNSRRSIFIYPQDMPAASRRSLLGAAPGCGGGVGGVAAAQSRGAAAQPPPAAIIEEVSAGTMPIGNLYELDWEREHTAWALSDTLKLGPAPFAHRWRRSWRAPTAGSSTHGRSGMRPAASPCRLWASTSFSARVRSGTSTALRVRRHGQD